MLSLLRCKSRTSQDLADKADKFAGEALLKGREVQVVVPRSGWWSWNRSQVVCARRHLAESQSRHQRCAKQTHCRPAAMRTKTKRDLGKKHRFSHTWLRRDSTSIRRACLSNSGRRLLWTSTLSDRGPLYQTTHPVPWRLPIIRHSEAKMAASDIKYAGQWDSALKGNSAIKAHIARAAASNLHMCGYPPDVHTQIATLLESLVRPITSGGCASTILTGWLRSCSWAKGLLSEVGEQIAIGRRVRDGAQKLGLQLSSKSVLLRIDMSFVRLITNELQQEKDSLATQGRATCCSETHDDWHSGRTDTKRTSQFAAICRNFQLETAMANTSSSCGFHGCLVFRLNVHPTDLCAGETDQRADHHVELVRRQHQEHFLASLEPSGRAHLCYDLFEAGSPRPLVSGKRQAPTHFCTVRSSIKRRVWNTNGVPIFGRSLSVS